jgi:hypothetical protein
MKAVSDSTKSNKLTSWILISLVLGIVVGYICHQLAPDAEAARTIAGYFSIISDVFLRLIKMIIAPLVFSTLVAGIASLGVQYIIGHCWRIRQRAFRGTRNPVSGDDKGWFSPPAVPVRLSVPNSPTVSLLGLRNTVDLTLKRETPLA